MICKYSKLYPIAPTICITVYGPILFDSLICFLH